jgi:hypothetical protein
LREIDKREECGSVASESFQNQLVLPVHYIALDPPKP